MSQYGCRWTCYWVNHKKCKIDPDSDKEICENYEKRVKNGKIQRWWGHGEFKG